MYHQLAIVQHPSSLLLRLRWLQLRRSLPLYGTVLLALAVGSLLWLLRTVLLRDASYAPYITGSAFLTVWGMHQRRPDLHFLLRHVPQPRLAMAVEYAVLLSPMLVVLLLARAWIHAGLLPLACALAWSPAVRSSDVRGRWLRRAIPERLFEWRGAVQGAWPWVSLLWLTALAFCWLPVLPLFLLGAIAMVASGAQEQCEPRAMLLATSPDARSLLRTKVVGAMRIMALLLWPVLIGATCSMPAWWWIHALFGIGLMVLVAYAVVLKYSNYVPNARLNANGANVAIAAVFAILPGATVVPLIMLLTEWPKAHANLRSYFHDPHQ